MNSLPSTSPAPCVRSAQASSLRPQPRRRRWHTSAVARAVMVVLAVGSVGWVSIAAAPRYRQPSSPPPLTNSELAVTLLRSGISPEALAAAGFTGPQTTALVDRARDTLSESIVDLRAADAALAEQRGRVDRLERLVRSGLSQEQDRQDLPSARTARTTAQSTLDSELQAVRSDALGDGQSEGRLLTLSTIRANSRWKFPAQYLCRTAAEAQWVELRNALSIKRQAERDNLEVPGPAAQVLTQWNADTNVSAAAANLAANLPEVQTAWDIAIDGNP
jgi:hypothetical protein